MNNDSFNDSFNDSDEIISVYSSKKVTDTFKAQLKKIAAQNNYVKNAVFDVNSESINCQDKVSVKNNSTEAVCGDHTKEYELSNFIKDKERSPSIEPIVIDKNDSIEFLEVSSETVRRSDRLKKKKSPINCSSSERQINVDNRFLNNKNKSKEKTRKKHSKKKIPDEIVIEDSPEELEADEELNPELCIKVIWKSVNVKKFQIRKFQKLSHIYELLSKEENIPEDKIILTFNNIRVSRNDTPDSLNLQVYHFLDGGVLSQLSNSCQTELENSNSDGNVINLKFQDVNKKVIKLCLQRSDKLKVGMIKCAEQLETPLAKIKFFFDGELLKPSETPDSLGLENDEVIDIKIL